jgi:hypothetical protein
MDAMVILVMMPVAHITAAVGEGERRRMQAELAVCRVGQARAAGMALPAQTVRWALVAQAVETAALATAVVVAAVAAATSVAEAAVVAAALAVLMARETPAAVAVAVVPVTPSRTRRALPTSEVAAVLGRQRSSSRGRGTTINEAFSS